MVAILFASKNVAEVHLDGRGGDGKEGVAQSHAGVAIAAKVDDEAAGCEASALYVVDEFPLNIALEIANGDAGKLRPQAVDILVEGGGAVDFRLAASREVQVWPVDDFYCFHNKITPK